MRINKVRCAKLVELSKVRMNDVSMASIIIKKMLIHFEALKMSPEIKIDNYFRKGKKLTRNNKSIT